jgi:hypothetical protein
MPDEMIQLPAETDAMDEIFQTLSQIGEVVENEEAENKKTHSIICPKCGQKIPYPNNS